MLCVKHVHQDSSCFLACETHQKVGEAYVDSQIWHLLRSTGLTGRADRSDRFGLYSPSRIRVFVKSPNVILLVKGQTGRPQHMPNLAVNICPPFFLVSFTSQKARTILMYMFYIEHTSPKTKLRAIYNTARLRLHALCHMLG